MSNNTNNNNNNNNTNNSTNLLYIGDSIHGKPRFIVHNNNKNNNNNNNNKNRDIENIEEVESGTILELNKLNASSDWPPKTIAFQKIPLTKKMKLTKLLNKSFALKNMYTLKDSKTFENFTNLPIPDWMLMGLAEQALGTISDRTDLKTYFPTKHKNEYLFDPSKRLYNLTHCLSNNDYKLDDNILKLLTKKESEMLQNKLGLITPCKIITDKNIINKMYKKYNNINKNKFKKIMYGLTGTKIKNKKNFYEKLNPEVKSKKPKKRFLELKKYLSSKKSKFNAWRSKKSKLKPNNNSPSKSPGSQLYYSSTDSDAPSKSAASTTPYYSSTDSSKSPASTTTYYSSTDSPSQSLASQSLALPASQSLALPASPPALPASQSLASKPASSASSPASSSASSASPASKSSQLSQLSQLSAPASEPASAPASEPASAPASESDNNNFHDTVETPGNHTGGALIVAGVEGVLTAYKIAAAASFIWNTVKQSSKVSKITSNGFSKGFNIAYNAIYNLILNKNDKPDETKLKKIIIYIIAEEPKHFIIYLKDIHNIEDIGLKKKISQGVSRTTEEFQAELSRALKQPNEIGPSNQSQTRNLTGNNSINETNVTQINEEQRIYDNNIILNTNYNLVDAFMTYKINEIAKHITEKEEESSKNKESDKDRKKRFENNPNYKVGLIDISNPCFISNYISLKDGINPRFKLNPENEICELTVKSYSKLKKKNSIKNNVKYIMSKTRQKFNKLDRILTKYSIKNSEYCNNEDDCKDYYTGKYVRSNCPKLCKKHIMGMKSSKCKKNLESKCNKKKYWDRDCAVNCNKHFRDNETYPKGKVTEFESKREFLNKIKIEDKRDIILANILVREKLTFNTKFDNIISFKSFFINNYYNDNVNKTNMNNIRTQMEKYFQQKFKQTRLIKNIIEKMNYKEILTVVKICMNDNDDTIFNEKQNNINNVTPEYLDRYLLKSRIFNKDDDNTSGKFQNLMNGV
jgi:hypothetical protein